MKRTKQQLLARKAIIGDSLIDLEKEKIDLIAEQVRIESELNKLKEQEGK